MATFIDRRVDSKGRSAVNRERFIRRYKKHIREAVDRMVSERSIRDMEKGGVVDIPARDITKLATGLMNLVSPCRLLF